jgi:acyl carrier protein phosphodiesterase
MLMPYMIQNWLLSYQTIEGINNILTQMDGRTKNKSKMRLLQRNSGSYTLNLRRTLQIFLTIWEHAKQKLIEE